MSIELKREDYDWGGLDMDGTLTDSETELHRLLGEACDFISKKYNIHIPNLYKPAMCSSNVYDDWIKEAPFKSFPGLRGMLREEARTLYLENRERFFVEEGGFKLFPDVEPFLDLLLTHFENIILVTSNHRIYADAFLKQNGLDISSIAKEDVDNIKPHPEPYRKAANIGENDPSRGLVFEDTWQGALSAVSLGVKTIIFRGKEIPEELKEYDNIICVQSFNEITFAA